MGNGKVFLEIGTCDFDTCLPLAEAGWSGYMIEADPRYAEIMANKTAQYDVQVDNVAMSDKNGIVSFRQSVSNDDWSRGVGHVDSDSHAGRKLLDIKGNEVLNHGKIEVSCMTLDSYINEHNIKRIDFLKVDVEGHEINVLAGFSWDIKPTFIKIEYVHVDIDLLLGPLREQGYTCWVEERDIYAII